jgi:hypothetical protein
MLKVSVVPRHRDLLKCDCSRWLFGAGKKQAFPVGIGSLTSVLTWSTSKQNFQKDRLQLRRES